MTGLERLEKSCDWNEFHVKDGQFDMALWLAKYETCGSVGCFVGNAALCPEIAAEGLKVEIVYSGGVKVNAPVFGEDEFGEQVIELRACADFYEITYDEAEHLFLPYKYDQYPNRLDVVRRVREFIKRKKEEAQQ